MAVGCPSNGCRASSSISDILASPAQKMIPPPDIWGAPFWRLTCGPTKLTRTEGFVNLVYIWTILAPVIVRCPSNDRSASSTSGLLAPAAQTSAGRVACSCLPWLAVMPRKPHHPLLLPPLARASLYSPTPPVILWRRQPHTAAEPVNPRTPLRVGIHCRVFPGSASSPS